MQESEDLATYQDIDNENDSNLTEREKLLEKKFNEWDKATNSEKFQTFRLFSLDYFNKFFPVSLVFCIYVFTNIANIMFVSHTEKDGLEDLLGGVGIGVIFYNMVGVSLCFGLASALDTLCTHAYGAKMYYLMGCYLNRARIILTLTFIPVFFFLFFIESFLLLIGQDPNIAVHAGNFCRGLIPGLWFFYQTDAYRRYSAFN